MSYKGDINAGDTLRFTFNTRQATGAPITLGGTPVISVYKDASVTESTTGVTLTVDFDSVTGRHLVTIDTSADGTFYSAGSDFQVTITTGTVDGTSVVGVVVAEFSVENRNIKADPVSLGGDAQSLLDLKDFADAGYDPATNKVQGVVLVDTTTTLTGHTAQTGDSYTRLGPPDGASISADIAAAQSYLTSFDANGVDLTSAAINSIWQLDLSGLGFGVGDQAFQVLMDTQNLATAAGLATVAGYLDTEIAAIQTAVVTTIPATLAAMPAALEAAILNEGDATALLAAIAAKVEEFLINEGDATATLAAIATAVNAAVVAGQVGTDAAAIKTAVQTTIPGTLADATNGLAAIRAWAESTYGAVDTMTTIVGTPVDVSLVNDITNLSTKVGTPATGTVSSDLAAIAGYIDTEVGAIKAVTDQFVFTVANQVDANALTGGGGASAADIADAVWVEMLADHAGVSGSVAEQLAAAGAAGNPWLSEIPGTAVGTQAGSVLQSIYAKTSVLLADNLFYVAPRDTGRGIVWYVDETFDYTMFTTEDTTLLTIQLVIRFADGTESIIADGDFVTKDPQFVVFLITPAITAEAAKLTYQLQDISGAKMRVIRQGDITVRN